MGDDNVTMFRVWHFAESIIVTGNQLGFVKLWFLVWGVFKIIGHWVLEKGLAV